VADCQFYGREGKHDLNTYPVQGIPPQNRLILFSVHVCMSAYFNFCWIKKKDSLHRVILILATERVCTKNVFAAYTEEMLFVLLIFV
jgi:hypothetical protein